MRTCRHASGKLNKLYKSWRSPRAGASPHCGMPSRLKSRLYALALSDRIPAVSRKTLYKAQTFIAGARRSLKGGVLWSKDKLKATKGCCQSR